MLPQRNGPPDRSLPVAGARLWPAGGSEVDGDSDIAVVQAAMRQHLDAQPGVQVDYAVIADADTLELVFTARPKMVALIAARVGTTRLIDNLTFRDLTAATLAKEVAQQRQGRPPHQRQGKRVAVEPVQLRHVEPRDIRVGNSSRRALAMKLKGMKIVDMIVRTRTISFVRFPTHVRYRSRRSAHISRYVSSTSMIWITWS